LFTQHLLNPEPGIRSKIDRESILRQISHRPPKAAHERESLWHAFNGMHHRHIDVQPYSPPSASRGRKIRCDGAKPKCYHCSRREGNEECTYDAIPKRRGPDRTQRARTSGTRQETEGEASSRRRRSGPTTVNRAGKPYSITQRSRVAAKPSVLDTLFDHPQQNDDCIHPLDPEFELLEGMTGFSTANLRNHSQMLTVDSAITGHAVSKPLLPSDYS
jgi:hypothetical protein